MLQSYAQANAIRRKLEAVRKRSRCWTDRSQFLYLISRSETAFGWSKGLQSTLVINFYHGSATIGDR